ncbi:MAG TPA: DEAD/DEAH box helicase [Chloroflexi bacterium]|nr:DEAD/DEAH box helicase [Chloroflexota bacterium]
MHPSAFLHQLVVDPEYRDELVHVERIAESEGVYGTPSHRLLPVVVQRLREMGIAILYRHQAQAIDLVLDGNHVVIDSPSASGKSLCYQIPTLDTLAGDEHATALYLFPTKALSQDQLASLRHLSAGLLGRGTVEAFDGDTPQEQRPGIRKRCRVLLTNPDMLHLGILPNHGLWSRYLAGLRYVVIDEAHTYRGIFGAHVANLIRRLRRISLLYGSEPVFICCSATIANPAEHAAALCGVEFVRVEGMDGPHGEKYFAFWNPPVLAARTGRRRSANTEASSLLCRLVSHGIRSLVFAKTRRVAELIYIYARERLPAELAARISPYRAGYLAETRRDIERRFISGELEGLVSTSALELGVDIGDLDATVLAGYPGNMASAWQQAGRSGRRGDPSLSVLVAQDNPLDQYLMHNPGFFFSRRFERALVNRNNPYVLGPHLLCAAWERPLGPDEVAAVSESAPGVVEQLVDRGLLRLRRGRLYPDPQLQYPAQRINLRAAGHSYSVIDCNSGATLETVDGSVALSQLHPGAVYLHQGETFLVRHLDIGSRLAWIEASDVDYYTQARELTDIRVRAVTAEKQVGDVRACLGDVRVTNHVVGFRKRRQFSDEFLGEEPLDLPEVTFDTRGFWFDVPDRVVSAVAASGRSLHGGLHACEHSLIGILPLFALCDRNDIGGVSMPVGLDSYQPQVYLYDAHPGGVGIAELGYEVIERLWTATFGLVQSCQCLDGCPGCIQSPKCGNNNEPLDKEAAIIILSALLNRQQAA